ncbi:cobalt transporter CbiM [Arcobacter sp. 15-2]|uniref:energy-coupling factor ABC transporter permease n=1 Tax=Arcobacter sp. 15-2 TaxID=3374109 RepID=UPI00399D1A02
MHISEGVLSAGVIATSSIILAPLILNSVRKLHADDISKVALLSALFFVVSTIHLPIGVTSVHFMMLGIIGIMLGWHSFTALLIALLLQAMLIGFGGISSLSVNTLNTGIGALTGFYLFKLLKDRLPTAIVSFLVGFIPILVASVGIAVALLFSSDDFLIVAQTALLAHLPLAFVEGIMMVFLFKTLQKYQIKGLNI